MCLNKFAYLKVNTEHFKSQALTLGTVPEKNGDRLRRSPVPIFELELNRREPTGTAPDSTNGPQGTVLEAKAAHEVFNVANGKDNTILELVDLLNNLIEKNINHKFLDPRLGDVFRTSADISKIKTKLGYQPKVDFGGGLRKTIDYFRTVYRVPSTVQSARLNE